MNFVDLLVYEILGIEPVLQGVTIAASSLLIERIGLLSDLLSEIFSLLDELFLLWCLHTGPACP
jgi:hypothetical protein